MFDVVIVGSGVGALTAALNLCARGEKIMLLTGYEDDFSTSELVDIQQKNIDENIAGILINMFLKLKNLYDVVPHSGLISRISNFNGDIMIHVDDDILESKNIILTENMLKFNHIDGELKHYNRGVSYSLLSDSAKYEGKSAIVYGKSKYSVSKANILQNKGINVTFISDLYSFGLQNNIECVNGKIEKIIGDKRLKYVVVNGQKYFADVLFILRNYIPLKTVIRNLHIVDEFVEVNERYMTNIPGVYAIDLAIADEKNIKYTVKEALYVCKIISDDMKVLT